MNANSTTIFIVDDDPAIRDALSLMIDLDNVAVQTYESAEAFLTHYQPECRGCAIIDIRMPGMSGLDLHKAMLARHILSVSYTHLDVYKRQVMHINISGFCRFF